MVCRMNSRPNDNIIGFSAGAVFGNNLIKHVQHRNILWRPEPCVTISKELYDAKRPFINRITFKIFHDANRPPEVYSLPAVLFDVLKITYDYGNGKNYRVAIKDFNKQGKQSELHFDENGV